ncbi:MAG: MSMEG_0567/Sll0786 family nitrogen starvation N-acetyltransferase [Acidimicrobiia bacterium]
MAERAALSATARELLSPEASPISCRVACSAEELALHHRIRHEVFVAEQRIFATTDLDTHDDETHTIRVIGLAGAMVAGAVRLYPLESSGELWLGDRLAVLPDFRIQGLGKPLVRFAVATAARLGGREMQAHIQPTNVRFFERLGWECRGPVEVYVGLPHQPMAIDLSGLDLTDPDLSGTGLDE